MKKRISMQEAIKTYYTKVEDGLNAIFAAKYVIQSVMCQNIGG